MTLASIGDAVITTDSRGMVEYLNPIAEALTGWGSADAQGQPLASVFRAVDKGTGAAAFDLSEMVLHTGRSVTVPANTLLVRRDGSQVEISNSAAPIRDRSGRVTGIVVGFHDVSHVRQYAARLSYQARHDDALIGLINRHEFEHQLSLALKSATQYRRSHSLLYLDLDQFKVLNDTCGHAAGDELMRQISDLLQERLRKGDTLARLGGDEFGVLLENRLPEHAVRVADQIRQAIREFRFVWAGAPFTVGVSVGVVSLGEDGHTLVEVLRAADAACYMAKEKGRNRVHVYRSDDSELSYRQGETQWVARIQRALDEGRFRLYVQEIFSLWPQLGRGVHYELLLRMVEERGELVPPGSFIPAAERYGLMSAVDRWVVANVFDTYSRLAADRQGRPIELCSINLSGASIGDEGFLDFLQAQAAVTQVPYTAFCFEVTETTAVCNLPKAVHFIGQLKALGCRFSLDDFGAGMSSFSYLKHLPVDYLKIDGSFVKDMLEDPIGRDMVEAINHIGHVMGKKDERRVRRKRADPGSLARNRRGLRPGLRSGQARAFRCRRLDLRPRSRALRVISAAPRPCAFHFSHCIRLRKSRAANAPAPHRIAVHAWHRSPSPPSPGPAGQRTPAPERAAAACRASASSRRPKLLETPALPDPVHTS